ncbi:amidohydrolase [bacterium]|nr:MAG: amidohydrolase [bacterium]
MSGNDTSPPRALRNAPPDPNPRRPRIALPPGSWDCHIHVFGPRADWPFEASSPYVSDDALPDDYLRMQRTLGFQHAVIVSAGGYGRDTAHLRSVLERHRGPFRGIILPPRSFAAADVPALDALGVRGIRFFAGPDGHEWSHLPQIEPDLARIAADAGWHVQYQSLVRGHLAEVAPSLLALPAPIVLDHCGAFDPALGLAQPAFTALLRMLDSGRVWVKLSGPMRCSERDFPYDDVAPFVRALVAHAPERLVFGSDWPHVQMNGRGMPNDGDLVDLLADWVPDARTRERILVDNARSLYE